MNEEKKFKNSELSPSKNQNALDRNSSLVERGLKLIQDLNRPLIKVRYGDSLPTGVELMVFNLVEFGTKERYNLEFGVSGSSEEVLALAEKGAIDIFVITVNNFTLDDFWDRLDNSLKLISQMRTKYGISVIALAALSLSEDKDILPIINKIKLAANFFLWSPPEVEDFMAAFEQCLIDSVGPIKC